MSYLKDYIYYSSGAETPEDYLMWGGLSILGHLLGNKVWITHGDHFRFFPNIYVALVGDAGAGKNTALSLNMDIMIEDYPDQLVSASIQSREDIAWQMSDDQQGLKVWKDQDGLLREYRPFYILNNELASFLSLDKLKMVEFLTEVYDGKRFSTGFKTDRKADPTRKQWFKNPHVSVLAGAVPTWFMGSLKMDLFSGGLGRRLIIVNAQRTKIVPWPKRPEGAEHALKRVKEHLRAAYEYAGEINRDATALRWWEDWYTKHKQSKPIDPILSQFHETEPMQVLKIATLLHMTERPFKKTMDAGPLMMAVQLIEQLKPQIVKLTSGIGRNELAGVGAEMLDFIARLGGMCSETQLRKQFYRYLKMPEFQEVENQFIKTEELIVATSPSDGRKYYFTKDGYMKYEAARKAREAEQPKERQAEQK